MFTNRGQALKQSLLQKTRELEEATRTNSLLDLENRALIGIVKQLSAQEIESVQTGITVVTTALAETGLEVNN